MKYIYIFLSLLLLASCSKKEECYECSIFYSSYLLPGEERSGEIKTDTSYYETTLYCDMSPANAELFVNENKGFITLRNREAVFRMPDGNFDRTMHNETYERTASCKKVKVKK